MASQHCFQPWSFMEIRDLFGDGSSSGDLVRVACFGHSSLGQPFAEGCDGSFGASECGPEAAARECVVRVEPSAAGLPRDLLRQAISQGADIVLEFLPGCIPSDSMVREIASVMRRLRTSGLSLTLSGLATSIRARISRQEALLGRS